jgi:hypothetical protein
MEFRFPFFILHGIHSSTNEVTEAEEYLRKCPDLQGLIEN